MIKTINFPNDLYEFLRNNTIVEVKGGKDRKTFLRIWMVEVNSRLFARSWNKSPKSWFTEFIKTGVGQIKYGANVIEVTGVKLAKDDKTNSLIDEAYLNKYTQKENLEYAKGITQPEYADFTMEFIYDIKEC